MKVSLSLKTNKFWIRFSILGNKKDKVARVRSYWARRHFSEHAPEVEQNLQGLGCMVGVQLAILVCGELAY